MLGRVIGRVTLTLVYFLVVTPIALFRRLLAGNPLRHAAGDLGYWLPHVPAKPEDMRKPS